MLVGLNLLFCCYLLIFFSIMLVSASSIRLISTTVISTTFIVNCKCSNCKILVHVLIIIFLSLVLPGTLFTLYNLLTFLKILF